MIRLLAFCDDPAVPTGFGRVADHVLKPLVDGGKYEVHICAMNYRGDTPDLARYPYRYYMPYMSPQKDAYGFGRVKELLARVEPDVVWLFNDLPILSTYFREGGDALKDVPTVAYTPIDGDPFPKSYLDGLALATIPAVYTQYAYDVIARTAHPMRSWLRVISHGHDPQEFYPLAEDKADATRLARQCLGERAGKVIDPNWYVVLRVDKNQERKNWPATLKAFAEFAQDKPEARLWCHTPFLVPNGYDIAALAERYNVTDKVIGSGLSARNLGIPVEALNLLYNAADVHFSTATGGGWELSTHEAKAAGTPTLITGYAGMTETGAVGGLLIPYNRKYIAMRNSTEYALIDEQAAVDRLEELYSDAEWRETLRKDALQWAQGMTWDAGEVAKRFDMAFHAAIAEQPEEIWHG